MSKTTRHVGEVVDEVRRMLANRLAGKWPEGITTGFAHLDDLVGGLRPGTVTILAGRPGTGVTTLALNIAVHAAVPRKQKTVFVSTADSPAALTGRMLSSLSGVDYHRIRRDRLDKKETHEVERTRKRLQRAPLYLCDAAGMSFDEADQELFALHDWMPDADARKQPRLAVIDSLDDLPPGNGFIEFPHDLPPEERRMAYFMHQMRRTAEFQRLAILATIRLPGEPHWTPRRPSLRELPHSGILERHSDVCLLLRRPCRSTPEGLDPECAELIVVRNRFGSTGSFRLDFDRICLRFGEEFLLPPQHSKEGMHKVPVRVRRQNRTSRE